MDLKKGQVLPAPSLFFTTPTKQLAKEKIG
jgi:hypothetical protein